MILRRIRTLTAAALALVVVLPGCYTPRNYFEQRVYDLADIVDVKVGCELDSFGLGAKVEATNYIGVGLGYGDNSHVTEQFGRHAVTGPMEFLHLIAYGLDGNHKNNAPGLGTEAHVMTINCCQEHRPPMIDRWRFGGEFMAFGLVGGAYLNLGELADFVLGIGTLDIAEDDAMAWNSVW